MGAVYTREIHMADISEDFALMQDVATVDSGHLAVFDPTPIDSASYRADPEAFLQSHTGAALRLLMRQLQGLPQEQTRTGAIATLPQPETILPREKPIPKPKPLTRWQKFAQEKGIRKQKRSKMVGWGVRGRATTWGLTGMGRDTPG